MNRLPGGSRTAEQLPGLGEHVVHAEAVVCEPGGRAALVEPPGAVGGDRVAAQSIRDGRRPCDRLRVVARPHGVDVIDFVGNRRLERARRRVDAALGLVAQLADLRLGISPLVAVVEQHGQQAEELLRTAVAACSKPNRSSPWSSGCSNARTSPREQKS